MEKKKNKKKFKDMPLEARNKIIGCIICLIALITSFVLGLFIGSFIPSNKANATEKNSTTSSFDVSSPYLYGEYYFYTNTQYDERWQDFDLWDTLNYDVYYPCLLSFQSALDAVGQSVFICRRATYVGSNSSVSADIEALCYTKDFVDYFPLIEFDLDTHRAISNIGFKLKFDFIADDNGGYNSALIYVITNSCNLQFSLYIPNSSDFGTFVNVLDENKHFITLVGNRHFFWLETFISRGIYPFFLSFSSPYCVLDVIYDESDEDVYCEFDFVEYNNVVFDLSYLGNPSNICVFNAGGNILLYDIVVTGYSQINDVIEEYDIAVYTEDETGFKFSNYFIIVPRRLNYTYEFFGWITVHEPQQLRYSFVVSSGVTYTKPLRLDDVTYQISVLISKDLKNPTVTYSQSLVASEIPVNLAPFVSWLVTGIGAFMDFSILPGLSLSVILGSILMLSLIVWLLKVFGGG